MRIFLVNVAYEGTLIVGTISLTEDSPARVAGEVEIVHDTIREQLAELIETRTPGVSLTAGDVLRRVTPRDHALAPLRDVGVVSVVPEIGPRALRS